MFKSTRKKERPPQSSRTKEKSTSLSPRTKSIRSKAATELQTTFRNKVAKAEDCGLCLEKMLYIKEQGTLATCGHTFHKKCIKDLITRGIKICPNCRTPFTAKDIITPNQYKILLATKNNQPHTLKKTLRFFDEAIADCKKAYEEYQDTIIAPRIAYSNYANYIDPPHWMLPSRKVWDKEKARLKKVWQDAAALNSANYDKYLLKCKVAAPFTAQSRINFKPNDYTEFNDYIQSIYESQNPNILKNLTTVKGTTRPYTFD
jgi:hypothetical protein